MRIFYSFIFLGISIFLFSCSSRQDAEKYEIFQDFGVVVYSVDVPNKGISLPKRFSIGSTKCGLNRRQKRIF